MAKRAISSTGDHDARNALLMPTKTPNKMPLKARITMPAYKLALTDSGKIAFAIAVKIRHVMKPLLSPRRLMKIVNGAANSTMPK